MKSLIPIGIIAVCGLIYVYYISPTIDEINALSNEKQQYQDVLKKAQDLTKQQEELQLMYSQISEEDIVRLKKMIPDKFDAVVFANDINAIASRYAIKIEQLSFNSPQGNVREDTVGIDQQSSYRTSVVTFSASGSYEAFKSFLDDLEYSLRLVDITQLTINSVDVDRNDKTNSTVPVLNYQIELKTYSLE